MFIGTEEQRACGHTYRRHTGTGGEAVSSCNVCGLLDWDLEVDDWLVGLMRVAQHPIGRRVLAQLLFAAETEANVVLPNEAPRVREPLVFPQRTVPLAPAAETGNSILSFQH